ncbi:hypothetical protein [Pseudogracilibacillus auburnensis]|uniref:hypothetical protein n=1 Tax=Pseudogracilibacillus auburnensis TaxID=1494959 RepID=UPI001A975914|nr:hypothetical protein [Pseudogracilibacillus auburnensis]MBO1004911.1 hypothetical protein [Pseudogracilibacillus auburnensis]
MRKRLLCVFLLLLVAGCVQKVPEPQSIHVEASETKRIHTSLDIRHHVHGNNVRVECIVEGVSFIDGPTDQERAKIVLYIDDQLYGEFHTAAFIVKNMKSGTHKMNLEVVQPSNRSLGLKQQFFVTIL